MAYTQYVHIIANTHIRKPVYKRDLNWNKTYNFETQTRILKRYPKSTKFPVDNSENYLNWIKCTCKSSQELKITEKQKIITDKSNYLKFSIIKSTLSFHLSVFCFYPLLWIFTDR